MAAITEAETAAIRAWVGSDPDNPTDVSIAARWDALGSVELVAAEILRGRRADLIVSGALDVDVSGDYSEDASKNLDALEADLEALGTVAGTTPTVTVPEMTFAELVRPDWAR